MSDMQPQGRYEPASELKELHETTDLDLKGVTIFTVVMIAVCAVTFYVLKLVMVHYKEEEDQAQKLKPPRFTAEMPIVGPKLQADPAKDTREVIQDARTRLDSYGWIDQASGKAHIPIQRAIDILVTSGLPKRGKVDEFHPRQGSSNPEMVGLPDPKAAETMPSTGPRP